MTALAVTPTAYGPTTMAGNQLRWPDAGNRLREELADAPGRIALLVGPPTTTDAAAGAIADVFGSPTVRLGAAAAAHEVPPTSLELLALAGQGPVVTDIDLLFAPQLATNPVTFIRTLARRQPTVAVWPGTVAAGRAAYSRPDRPDHFEGPLHDAIVLRAVPTRFPDEVPFVIERITP